MPITFDGQAGRAAVINHSVPLPGSHTGRRILQLDVGLDANDWLDTSKQSVTDLAAEVGLTATASGRYQLDVNKAYAFWAKYAVAAGISRSTVDYVERRLNAEASQLQERPMGMGGFGGGIGGRGGSMQPLGGPPSRPAGGSEFPANLPTKFGGPLGLSPAPDGPTRDEVAAYLEFKKY
jgi:hypothetical protein